MAEDQVSDGERLYAAVMKDSHLARPDDVATIIADAATIIGATETVAYLTDIEQLHLIPLAGPRVPPRHPLEIDNSVAGRAYRTVTTLETEIDDTTRVWLPLLDGTARIGVLEMALPSVDELTRDRATTYAGIVAELIVNKDMYGDAFKRLRRQQPMRLAAELQSEMLPPLTVSTPQMVLAGILEPSYAIAGDTFDYAINGDTVHVLIVDAMGHGFEATLMSSVAVGAYRHARRRGADLMETYAAMDEVIAAQFGMDRFVTAQLGELSLSSGRLQWLNAGHHPPILVRANRHFGPLTVEPTLPLGLGYAPTTVAENQLEPNDRLLFYTDGVVEARASDGEFFGEQRLADLLVRALTADLPAPETVRRLSKAILEHQDQELQDDATVLLIEWKGRG